MESGDLERPGESAATKDVLLGGGELGGLGDRARRPGEGR